MTLLTAQVFSSTDAQTPLYLKFIHTTDFKDATFASFFATHLVPKTSVNLGKVVKATLYCGNTPPRRDVEVADLTDPVEPAVPVPVCGGRRREAKEISEISKKF